MASKKPAKKPAGHPAKAGAPAKRVYFKQADFPQATLQQAQRIASTLVDNFAGRDGSPPDIALAIGIGPTSSAWPALAGASIAYGLTEGGVNANTIKLAPLGRKLVAPDEDGDDLAARREAILKPRISKEFFERYRRAKFPNDTIGGNVLRALGLPPDRCNRPLRLSKRMADTRASSARLRLGRSSTLTRQACPHRPQLRRSTRTSMTRLG